MLVAKLYLQLGMVHYKQVDIPISKNQLLEILCLKHHI